MITLISILFSLYVVFRIVFIDKEDKRTYKGWWEYDPDKFNRK